MREVGRRTPIAQPREHQRPSPGALPRQFGPYERFSAVDGIAYTDDRVSGCSPSLPIRTRSRR